MIYKEVYNANLFDYENEYYLAHCISSDFALGAGIALEFNKRYDMRNKLSYRFLGRKINCPTCILVDRVFNLVTKERYFNKPTYASLTSALEQMRSLALSNSVDKIAMPIIGCGLDRLEWSKVSNIIKNTFKNTNIEILIAHKEGEY